MALAYFFYGSKTPLLPRGATTAGHSQLPAGENIGQMFIDAFPPITHLRSAWAW